MLSHEMKRDDRGVDRCARIIMQAVPNVLGDDSKGYHNVSGPCGMPIVQRISDGVKGCPRCDKEPSVGNIHPKTTNSAGISLTPAELKECGLDVDSSKLTPSPETEMRKKRGRPKKTEERVEEALVATPKKGLIILKFSAADLARSEDTVHFLIKTTIDAMDDLPVANYGESRQLDKIRSKLESLLEA